MHLYSIKNKDNDFIIITLYIHMYYISTITLINTITIIFGKRELYFDGK